MNKFYSPVLVLFLKVATIFVDGGLPLAFGFSSSFAGSALTILAAGILAREVPARRLLPCFGAVETFGSS